MVRLTMLLLLLLLGAAVAGRVQAERAVRETRQELQELDKAIADELSQIQLLRAEVAYLESPDRLAAIAAEVSDLQPLSGAQMMSAEDFRAAFLSPDAPPPSPAGGAGEAARQAIAMTDVALTE